MTTLTNLEIDEVSLVDAGANPEANILIFKRDETQPGTKSGNFDELSATLKNLTDKLNEHVTKAEDAEFHKIAERYEILGTDADKLAPMLKAASKSNPTLYETAIRVLDGALEAVKKSGTFDEIGKRGTNNSTPDVQKIAAQIQKSQPNLTWRQAIDAAYLQHPELQ